MLTFGIRYTEEEKAFIGGQSYLTSVDRAYINNFENIGLPGEVGVANLLKKYDEISGKIGLTYQVSEDVMTYVTYSEGFKVVDSLVETRMFKTLRILMIQNLQKLFQLV